MSLLRIVLFRFHGRFNIYANHLALLRLFNPHDQVFGLYGGPEKHFAQASRLPLDHVWAIPIDNSYWKWVNGDLAVRWWYREVGEKLRFDILHLIEWDLLLLNDVAQRFRHIRDGVQAQSAPSRAAWFRSGYLELGGARARPLGVAGSARPRGQALRASPATHEMHLRRRRLFARLSRWLCRNRCPRPVQRRGAGSLLRRPSACPRRHGACSVALHGLRHPTISVPKFLNSTPRASTFHPVKESVDEAAIRHSIVQRRSRQSCRADPDCRFAVPSFPTPSIAIRRHAQGARNAKSAVAQAIALFASAAVSGAHGARIHVPGTPAEGTAPAVPVVVAHRRARPPRDCLSISRQPTARRCRGRRRGRRD